MWASNCVFYSTTLFLIFLGWPFNISTNFITLVWQLSSSYTMKLFYIFYVLLVFLHNCVFLSFFKFSKKNTIRPCWNCVISFQLVSKKVYVIGILFLKFVFILKEFWTFSVVIILLNNFNFDFKSSISLLKVTPSEFQTRKMIVL